jgi:hypothetical protein
MVASQATEAPCDLSRRQPGYYVPKTCRPTGYTLVKVPKKKNYELREKFEYVDRDGKTYVVPRSNCLPTDLASIPAFATWLVPKDGGHTQAALLHDAMIVGPGETPDYVGPPVTDERADRIFLDGMRIGGVPFFRRWIIWTAVAMRSYWLRPSAWSKLRLSLSIVVFAVFSLYALPDVLNLPQIYRFRGVLCIVAVVPVIAAALLVGRQFRGEWHVRAIGFSVAVLAAVGVSLILIAAVVPDRVTTWVPSFLPDIENGSRGFRWQGWRWSRPANHDAWFFQLGSFLVLLLIGAAGSALLLVRRPLFGFLLALLLGLLVYPLSFVAVSTGYYWILEGIGLAVKKVTKNLRNWLPLHPRS